MVPGPVSGDYDGRVTGRAGDPHHRERGEPRDDYEQDSDERAQLTHSVAPASETLAETDVRSIAPLSHGEGGSTAEASDHTCHY